MNIKSLRHGIFVAHRYLGLAIALVVVVIGLTGSLLVFRHEIAHAALERQIGKIVPQGELLSVEKILNAVKPIYANQPDATLQALYISPKLDEPANVVYATKAEDWIENYVNPYTDVFLGNTLKPNRVQQSIDVIYKLHYEFFLGEFGLKFVGIIGLLMCVLTITGVILWPGWRNFIAGFKIKWKAHPQRVNFDLHKVVGIVTVTFLLFTFFTGFCWNFSEFSDGLIRAVTFSPQKPEPVSQPIAGRQPLPITEQLETARAALPGAKLQTIYFPSTPEASLSMRYKFPQEGGEYGDTYIYLDRYSKKVLRVDSGLEQSLGDCVLNSFIYLHYGTFWGLPSQIFYVFVGLAPLILFVTSLTMWWHRQIKSKVKLQQAQIPSQKSKIGFW
jgi:uncharacterized iron-regulated membrane protein